MTYDISPSRAVKLVEAQVNRVLRKVDVLSLSRKERDILADLQQCLVDARKYTNGYEMSETREEQAGNAKIAKKWLGRAQKDILALGDIFDAADVAHLSVQIDQITEGLQ